MSDGYRFIGFWFVLYRDINLKAVCISFITYPSRFSDVDSDLQLFTSDHL